MKNKPWRRAAAIAVLAASLTVPVFADELEKKQQELEQIQQQMEQHKLKAKRARQQASTILGQIQEAEQELEAAESELEDIERRLERTERDIEAKKASIEKIEADLAERTVILNKRVREIYKSGGMSFAEVLFGARDLTDFTARMEFMKRVMAHDRKLLENIKTQRARLLQEKAELEKDQAAYVLMHKQTIEKKNIIAARRQEREELLTRVVYEREAAEKAYAELEQTSRQIERMIQEIQSRSGRSSASATGAFRWPVSGPITSPFGWRTHPIFGTQKFHSGIDLGVDYGTPVAAADSGVVIFADWMGGYGKTVIIDHGNGLSTLYAHNSQLLVGEGQRVEKGQIVSRVGSTGYSTGPHLHFEIRKNGAPINPLGYLP